MFICRLNITRRIVSPGGPLIQGVGILSGLILLLIIGKFFWGGFSQSALSSRELSPPPPPYLSLNNCIHGILFTDLLIALAFLNVY